MSTNIEQSKKSNTSDNTGPAEQSIYCWGQADNGELGLGDSHDQQSVIITPVSPAFPQSTVVKYGKLSNSTYLPVHYYIIFCLLVSE